MRYPGNRSASAAKNGIDSSQVSACGEAEYHPSCGCEQGGVSMNVREDLTDSHMNQHVHVRLIPLHLDRSYLFLPLRHVIGQL